MQFSRPTTTFSASSGSGAPKQQEPQGENASTVSKTIVRETPKIGRNDVVTVLYNDGRQEQGKFKKYEQDIESGKAEIVDQ
jgi:hypothetical protein